MTTTLHYYFQDALKKNNWQEIKRHFETVSEVDFNESFCQFLLHKNVPKRFLKGAINRLQEINGPVVPLNLLSQKGYNWKNKNNYAPWFNSALCFAIFHRNKNAVDLLLEKGAKVGLNEWLMVERLPPNKIQYWSKSLSSFNLSGNLKNQMVLVFAALRQNHSGLLDVVLESGLDPKEIIRTPQSYHYSNTKMTAFCHLLNQSWTKNPNFLQELHEEGLDPLAQLFDTKGQSYLSEPNSKLISILKKTQLPWDLNWRNSDGKSVFEKIQSSWTYQSLDLVLAVGVDLPAPHENESARDYAKRLQVPPSFNRDDVLLSHAQQQELMRSAPRVAKRRSSFRL